MIAQYNLNKTNPIQNSWNAFANTMIIFGGVTFYSADVGKNAFKGTGQIQISTDGKFFLNGTITLANSVSFSTKLYVNLSNVGSGKVTVLFLANIPTQPNFLVISGMLQIGQDSNSNVVITLAGDTTLYNPQNSSQEWFDITGQMVLTIDTTSVPNTTRLILNASGSIWVTYLQTIGSAAAEFVLVVPGSGSPQFWGVANLTFGTSTLIKYGININAFSQLMINTTNAKQTEELLLQVMQVTASSDVTTIVNALNAGGVLPGAGGVLPGSNILLTQMGSFNIPLSGAVTVTVLATNTQWRLTDTAGNVYIVNSIANNLGNPVLYVLQQKTFSLLPNIFSLQIAGLLIIGQPNAAKNAIATPYFSLTGVFDMEISSNSFSMFANAALVIGPTGFNLLNMQAMGLIIVNPDGLAVNLELQQAVNLGSLLTSNISFFLIANTTSKNETYIVPQKFISDGYLTQNFITKYIQTSNGISVITISAGMPQANGTFAAPGIYLIVQGKGTITIVNSLFLTGSFNIQIQVSPWIFSLQMNAAYYLQLSGVNLFSGTASGSLNFSSAGLYGYMNLSMAVGIPASAGFSLSGVFQFQINTTSSSQQVSQFQLDSNGNFVLDGSGQMILQQVNLNANTTQVMFGGNLTLGQFIVKGYTLIVVSPGSFQISILGKIQLGSFGTVTVGGGAGLYIEGSMPVFACNLSVIINLGMPSVSIFGSGTFNINTSTQNTYFGVAHSSFKINMSGYVQFLNILNINASLTISYVNGVFRIALNNASLDVFNFVTINVGFFIQSDGQFEVYGSTSGSADFVVVKMAFSLVVDVWNCQPGACLVNHGGATSGVNINIYGSMGIDLGIASVSASFNTQIVLANTYAQLSMAMTFRVKLLWIIHIDVGWSWSHTWTPIIISPGQHAPFDPNYSFYNDAFSIFWYLPSPDLPIETGNYSSMGIVWGLVNNEAALQPGTINLVVNSISESLFHEFYFIRSSLVDKMQLQPVTADQLPGELPAGLSYEDGVQIYLFEKGRSVSKLEASASMIMLLSFPASINPDKLVFLYWDATLNGGRGGWVKLHLNLMRYLGNGKWSIDNSQLQLLLMILEKMAAQNHTDRTGELGSLAVAKVNGSGIFVLALEP